MREVIRLDDGKSDPVSVAYGIEPACAVEYEKVIQTALKGMTTIEGLTYTRSLLETDELKMITSSVLAYRASNIRQSKLPIASATGDTLAAVQAADERRDYTTEIELLQPLAEQGNVIAQDALGLMYGIGKKVPQDYAEAFKWFRMAAEQGDPNAQNAVGEMYDSGKGVTKDYTEAAKWYQRAAEQGYAKAQGSLGVMYYNGLGVPKDYTEAVKRYRAAADQGDERAQGNLGFMYDTGKGVPQDYAEAVKWYRRASDQGDADAQSSLGTMYYAGLGVPQDYVQAYKWLDLASTRLPAWENIFREKIIETRNHIVAKLTTEQLAEARRLAREWKPIKEGN